MQHRRHPTHGDNVKQLMLAMLLRHLLVFPHRNLASSRCVMLMLRGVLQQKGEFLEIHPWDVPATFLCRSHRHHLRALCSFRDHGESRIFKLYLNHI